MNTFKSKPGSSLSNIKNSHLITIKKPSTNEKFIEVENIFIGLVNDNWVAYDTVCDHNGGKLCLNQDGASATCPLHGWKIHLKSALYENGCHKKSLPVIEKEDALEISLNQPLFPYVDQSQLTDTDINFYFNAHASVTICIDEFTITTDPWIVGPCFTTGWWHRYPATESAGERVRASDLIYISHNHPDHLHIDSLKKFVKDDQCFLVPNFESKSVELVLRKNGFNNLIILDFMQELIVEKGGLETKLVIVKSGDARDDSSLLVFTKKNTSFFAVDTNMPNSWVLPKCDIIFTSFAGGMSGYPMRIENLDIETKRVHTQNIANTLLDHHVYNVVKSTKSRYVVPYAGYFTYAPRDSDVSVNTPKNSPDEMINFCKYHFNTTGINPIETGNFQLKNSGEIELLPPDEFEPLFFLDDEYFESEIKKFSKNLPDINKVYLEKLGETLIRSGFRGNITIAILPTNSDFQIIENKLALIVDFSSVTYVVKTIKEDDSKTLATQLKSHTKNNIEILKVREDSLKGALYRGLPIEDLSIGFQVSMYREPNVYNFEFWNYFTNLKFIRLEA
jgi:CMP-N-acetylneuraminate monooxygenase